MNERRVCVLGEPLLRSEHGDVVIKGRPGRTLAALLAGEGGQTLDQLAELVWSGSPPKTARQALHVHLGTLRKHLADAPDGLAVDRHGEQYVLVRSGWSLDVELVGEYSAGAADLTAAGESKAASVELQRALELWRGEPFTVGGTEVSPTATHQLRLVRLDLEERLVDALLDANEPRPAELLAVRYADAEPYRERRWAQLMRARILQGRAVDALTAYEEVSNLLHRDLGVAPGEELIRLERSVLTHDLSAASSRPPAHADLGEIPGALGDLIGRSELLAQIESALARLVPVLVCGAPGAGKTRLAVEVARRASAAGQPVAWIDLRNVAFDPCVVGDGVTRWARRHADGLVVLDNAEQTADVVADLVTVGLRVAPSVRVLVTSRVPMLESAAVVTVDPLQVPAADEPAASEGAESVRLLRSLLGLLAPGVALDPESAAELCRTLGGLPLAIRVAAELARSLPIPEIAAAASARLGPDLEGAISTLLDHLGPGHGEAFASLSTVAGELDADLIVALVGGDDASGRISRLVDHGLVHFAASEDGRYSVPEPLREVGVSMLTDIQRRDTLDRLSNECLARARRLALPTPTSPTGDRLEDLLRRELPWHRQTLDHLAAVGDDRRALELVAALELQLYSLGWWQENLELQDVALSIPGPPSAVRAHVHAVRGRPGQFHQFDEEHNQIALAMADDVSDLGARARAGYHLGVLRWWAGDCDDALTWFERARADAEAAEDRFLIGEAMRFIGMTLVTAGHAERGLAAQLELVDAVERVPPLAMLLPHLYMHLGHSRRHVGDTSAALADLGRARDGFEQIGNRASLIHVCAGLAEVYADLGRYDQALEAAAQSLDVSAGGTIDVYDPWTLCTTARVHVAVSDHDLARRAARRAIDALAKTFDGERHRVATELTWVAHELGEHRATLRLAGLADATPDRRELPFRSPGERARLQQARDGSGLVLGDEADAITAQGASSSLAEAAALLTDSR